VAGGEFGAGSAAVSVATVALDVALLGGWFVAEDVPVVLLVRRRKRAAFRSAFPSAPVLELLLLDIVSRCSCGEVAERKYWQ